MSNKERAIALLDQVPDYKMGYVLAYIQGMAAAAQLMGKEKEA